MKEGYTIIKDSIGEPHEAPIIKAPYLKYLLNKTIDVVFADRSCIGFFLGEDPRLHIINNERRPGINIKT